jgi:hypothetical protein
MLDPDPESMNPDPKHCYLQRLLVVKGIVRPFEVGARIGSFFLNGKLEGQQVLVLNINGTHSGAELQTIFTIYGLWQVILYNYAGPFGMGLELIGRFRLMTTGC